MAFPWSAHRKRIESGHILVHSMTLALTGLKRGRPQCGTFGCPLPDRHPGLHQPAFAFASSSRKCRRECRQIEEEQKSETPLSDGMNEMMKRAEIPAWQSSNSEERGEERVTIDNIAEHIEMERKSARVWWRYQLVGHLAIRKLALDRLGGSAAACGFADATGIACVNQIEKKLRPPLIDLSPEMRFKAQR